MGSFTVQYLRILAALSHKVCFMLCQFLHAEMFQAFLAAQIF